MLDVSKIPKTVLDDILSNLGVDEDSSDKERGRVTEKVEAMDVYDAFDCFLTWNGIMGYTSMIINALDGLRAAKD